MKRSTLLIKAWLILHSTALFANPEATVTAAEEGPSNRALSRTARLFSPKLREVEDRLDWLRDRLASLADYSPLPLADGLGWRAGYSADESHRPALILDLGKVVPLDDVYLVPAQARPGESASMFPKRYRIEASRKPDFSDANQLHATPVGQTESQDGYPRRHPGGDHSARFLRLVVEEGHLRSGRYFAAISELLVVSGGEPVSFSASTRSEGQIDTENRWEARFAIDGRTPLGSWESGQWTRSRGFRFEVPAGDQQAEWIIDLGRREPIDRVVLFPYSLPELAGPGITPGDFEVLLLDTPGGSGSPGLRYPGGESICPLTVPLGERRGRYVLLRARRAFQLGEQRIHALSEIQVWSDGRNLASGLPVSIRAGGRTLDPGQELTDGHGNGLQILTVPVWLNQLTERLALQREQDRLAPLQLRLSTESEVNIAWGTALAVGLTLLLPLIWIRRHRLVSRGQLDHLRKRIASDLHDDIGSNLGSISLIARAACRELNRHQGPPEVIDDLEELEVIARESSMAMRDIVWLLERQEDTIGDFVQRMRDSASRMLRDVDYHFVCRSQRTATMLSPDAKRHLFLFYKEALHNVLKHAKAHTVDITVYDASDHLIMEVRDDGIGLPSDATGRRAAVRKLSERAAALDGELKVESSPGGGTLLRLDVPRNKLTNRRNVA